MGQPSPPFEGIQDVRAAVELASRGGVLDPPVLRAVATTVGGGLRVRAALGEAAPLLSGLASAIEPGLGPLGEEIGRAIEEDGSDVRDSASPAAPASCAGSCARRACA